MAKLNYTSELELRSGTQRSQLTAEPVIVHPDSFHVKINHKLGGQNRAFNLEPLEARIFINMIENVLLTEVSAADAAD